MRKQIVPSPPGLGKSANPLDTSNRVGTMTKLGAMSTLV
jgi:hypothetical protein